MENGGRKASQGSGQSSEPRSEAVIVQGLQEGETVIIPSFKDDKATRIGHCLSS